MSSELNTVKASSSSVNKSDVDSSVCERLEGMAGRRDVGADFDFAVMTEGFEGFSSPSEANTRVLLAHFER